MFQVGLIRFAVTVVVETVTAFLYGGVIVVAGKGSRLTDGQAILAFIRIQTITGGVHLRERLIGLAIAIIVHAIAYLVDGLRRIAVRQATDRTHALTTTASEVVAPGAGGAGSKINCAFGTLAGRFIGSA